MILSASAALIWRINFISVDKETRLNDEITSGEVRLIDKDGEQVGVVTIEVALQLAEEAELDLVEIVPAAEPPVCRVMDYGKYLFELNKKKHAAKKETEADSG